MENMVTEARKYLDSEEGKQFESSLQQEFTKDRSDNKHVREGISQDNEEGDLNLSDRQGNAGQGQDSTSGMNSAPSSRLRDDGPQQDSTSQYNGAGREQMNDEGPYSSYDSTSSGGYGTNSGGDSFSPSNQNGMFGNRPGQFRDNSQRNDSAADPSDAYQDQRSADSSGYNSLDEGMARQPPVKGSRGSDPSDEIEI